MVFKGWRNGVDPVAVKVLKGEQDARLTDAFIKEIDILRRARHPHVVQYVGLPCRSLPLSVVWQFLACDMLNADVKPEGAHCHCLHTPMQQYAEVHSWFCLTLDR